MDYAGGTRVLLSDNGECRVTLCGDIATIRKKSGGGRKDWQEWQSGKFEMRQGAVEITYPSKKKGGTVEYSIVPDFDVGTFTGNLSYEE